MANIDNLDISIKVTNLTTGQIKNIQDLTKSLSSLNDVLSDTLIKKLEILSNLKININLNALREVNNSLKNVESTTDNLSTNFSNISKASKSFSRSVGSPKIKELEKKASSLAKQKTSLGTIGDIFSDWDKGTVDKLKEAIPELGEYADIMERLSKIKANKLEDIDGGSKRDLPKNERYVQRVTDVLAEDTEVITEKTIDGNKTYKYIDGELVQIVEDLKTKLDEIVTPEQFGNKTLISSRQKIAKTPTGDEQVLEQKYRAGNATLKYIDGKLVEVVKDEREEVESLNNAYDNSRAKLLKTTVALKKTKDGMKEVTTVTKQFGNNLLTYVDGNLVKVTKKEKGVSKFAKGFKKLFKSIGRIAMYRAIRSVLRRITESIKFAITEFASFDSKFRGTMTRISSSVTNLKASFAGVIAPILDRLEPFIVRLLNWFTELNNKFAMIVASIKGAGTYTKVLTSYQEEYNKQVNLLSFDKFEVLNKNKKYGGFKTEKVDENLVKKDGLKTIVETIKHTGDVLLGKYLPAFNSIWKVIKDIYYIIEPIVSLIRPITDIIGEIIRQIGLVFEGLHKILGQDSVIGNALRTIVSITTLPLVGILDDIANILKTINDFFDKIFDHDFEGLKDIFKDFIENTSAGKIGKFIVELFGGNNNNSTVKPSTVSFHAMGGVPNMGTQFIAGERGAEIVGTMSSGKTGVMNMQQLYDAVYKGMVGAIATMQNTNKGTESQPIVVNISDEKLFEITRQSAKRRGLDFVNI